MLDKLIKIYSLSGALLIFCGVLKLVIFYSYFSIDIIEFLTFSEIITSFLDDINILIVFAIIMFITSFLTFSLIEKKTKIPIEFFFEMIFKHKIKYALFFGVVIFTLYTLIRLQIISTSYTAIYFIAFCSIQMFSYIFMYRNEQGEVTFSDNKIGFSTAISFMFIIYLLAQHDIEQTLYHSRKVNIVTNNAEILCSDSKNIFIGKTDNYIFIRNNIYSSTIVFPSSEIKQYSFLKQ